MACALGSQLTYPACDPGSYMSHFAIRARIGFSDRHAEYVRQSSLTVNGPALTTSGRELLRIVDPEPVDPVHGRNWVAFFLRKKLQMLETDVEDPTVEEL